MSTLHRVEEILIETSVPMSVREIVEYAGSSLPSRSKTPDTVVARDLSMDIKKKGEDSKFIRTSPGRYTMRAIHAEKMAIAEAAHVAAEGASNEAAISSAIPSERAPTLPSVRRTELELDPAITVSH